MNLIEFYKGLYEWPIELEIIGEVYSRKEYNNFHQPNAALTLATLRASAAPIRYKSLKRNK